MSGASAVQASGLRAAAVPSRPVALAFRVFAFVAIAAGIARITELFSGAPTWAALKYYTVQSNLLCLVWMALLVAVTVRDLRRDGPRGHSTPSARWSAAVMMAITVTMLVYLVVLVPTAFVQGGDYAPFSLTDNLIHIFTPCFLIADWLLFVPKGRLRGWDPLLWAIIPLTYLAYALVYGGLGGEFMPGQHYPYPFLDVDTLGVGGVASGVSLLAVSLIGVGYVYVALDRVFSGSWRRATA